MMLGDASSVDNYIILSVGSRHARTHGYYKGDAFGVINDMHKIICEKSRQTLAKVDSLP